MIGARPFILPVATIDEVRAELEDTLRSLRRLTDGYVVDRERLEERRHRLLRWKDRLEEQLDAMERAAA